ncbi:glycosyltransferase family 4 protein [Kocuria rosea]|uniref:glycosyltransferase family 4 protein n=1 Tax=Kocuria rosea TaxID=1275 RepID=UPI0025B7597F|nr:glycosyltransferase family 4 protein [Kocuria rosea]WJZ65519.1 glycosyltransferase family 4 protein [Kocuria rosea]
MKIAIVHSYYTDKTPSGENITVDLQAEALANAGHTVRVIGVSTDDLARESLYKTRTAVKVASGRGLSPLPELERFSPDVTHIHNLFPNFSTGWLQRWQGPVIATLHNFRPLCSNGLLFRDGHKCTLCPDRGQHHALIHSCYKNSRIATLPITIKNRGQVTEDAVIKNASKLIVLSQRSIRTYEQYGVPSTQMEMIPNFINEPAKWLDEDNMSQSWLYAGRLNPEKGIIDLLDNWPSDRHIRIAGAGTEEESIKKISNNRPNVTYIGSLSRENMIEEVGRSKGLVIPSLCAENLPTVYLEALASGIPVIAREGNSAADDVNEWAPGLTYGSEETLALALGKADSQYHQLRNAAKSRFKSLFTEHAWIKQIEKVYDTACQRDTASNPGITNAPSCKQ